jgi:hypothetical protein
VRRRYSTVRLHSTLTLPRLRESWARACGGAERSGASRFTGPERAEFYRYAARQAATVADHLRHCTATDPDPDQGADPAWAVADALHTAAGATGSWHRWLTRLVGNAQNIPF